MTQHTGKGHVPAERLREILDALGMAPTRDWDDVLNAARCLHKNASGDAVARGEQPDDEVARLRSVLAGRERELKAALTQVHELRTAADTGQVGQTGADWAVRPRRFSPEDTLSVAERLGAAEPSGDTGRPTVEPSDAWVIGRFTDATAQRGDRTFEMWDDDVHRTSAAALHHHVMHVEDPDPWSWHIYALVRIAAPGSSRDTVQAPTAEIAGWDGAS